MAARYAPIGRKAVANLRRDLDSLITRAESQDDLELRADLAKYACLRLAGFLEQALLSCGRSVVAAESRGRAASFADSHLDKSFNPRRDAITAFVGRFDTGWQEQVELFLGESERGQTINALVGIRNQIAHGANQGISIERVKEYRSVVTLLLDCIVDLFDPLPRKAVPAPPNTTQQPTGAPRHPVSTSPP